MKTTLALVLVLAWSSAAHAQPLRLVKSGHFGLCAIRANNTIVCEKDEPPTTDRARDFTEGSSPVIVRTDGTLVRHHGSARTPIEVGFKVQRIGKVGTKLDLCAIGEKREIACGSAGGSDKTLALKRIEGTFVDVQLANEELWAVDTRGALWCRGAGACARIRVAVGDSGDLSRVDRQRYPDVTKEVPEAGWGRVTNGVKRLFASGDPCVSSTSLVCWGDFAPVDIPTPKGDEVITAANQVCARTRDTIVCRKISTTEQSTFTVKAAAAMHYGRGRFCVSTTSGTLHCTNVETPMAPLQTVAWQSATP